MTNTRAFAIASRGFIKGAEELAEKHGRRAEAHLGWWWMSRDPHELIAFEQAAIAQQLAAGAATARKNIARETLSRMQGD